MRGVGCGCRHVYAWPGGGGGGLGPHVHGPESRDAAPVLAPPARRATPAGTALRTARHHNAGEGKTEYASSSSTARAGAAGKCPGAPGAQTMACRRAHGLIALLPPPPPPPPTQGGTLLQVPAPSLVVSLSQRYTLRLPGRPVLPLSSILLLETAPPTQGDTGAARIVRHEEVRDRHEWEAGKSMTAG
jgi:hypothetical protein